MRFLSVCPLPPLLAALLFFAQPARADAQLRGSRRSMVHQHKIAQRNDFTFLKTTRDVQRFVRKNLLVRIKPTQHFVLRGVSFPYARPQVRTFIQRLAAQYHAATGERLVVTSLVRPISRQPDNASELSVHPAGIAVDLRIPSSAADRKWLEHTLLYLEDHLVLDVTKEHSPAHYHVAVFPQQYQRYVNNRREDRDAN